MKAELARQKYLARMAEERRLRHLNTESDYSTPSRPSEEVSGMFKLLKSLRVKVKILYLPW